MSVKGGHRRPGIIGRILCTVVLGAIATGCTTARNQRGYVMDDELVGNISSGVDNRASVLDMLGNPSTTSAFGQETWYYISSQTVTQGFLEERPVRQRVVAIEFTDGGTVEGVKNYTLADAKRITPVEATTPIRGKTLGFFEQLLRGVGRVGPGLGNPGGPQRQRGPGRR